MQFQTDDIIVSLANPDWGTWRVLEDNGDHFVIRGRPGARVLHYSEAATHWDKHNGPEQPLCWA